METLVSDYLGELIGPFVDPRKRVFIGYLGAALVIALSVQLIGSRATLRQAVRDLFARRVWISASALGDYKILLINQAVMMGVAPRLITKLALATLLFEALHVWFDGRTILWPAAPAWMIAGLFTLCLFLLDDAARYLVHRALHRVPLLWCFHRVHHTAETLTPLTVYRTHPVEAVIFALRSVLVQAIAVAGFLYFFGGRAELVTILGANVFLFLFNVAGSNLRHSHVWISYGRIIERLLISPAQHQIHHSLDRRHHDRNFGAVLAIWDWIGGSLCLAERGRAFSFGVDDGTAPRHDLKSLYLTPFADAARILMRILTSGMSSMTGSFLFRRRWRSVVGGIVLFVGLVVLSAPALAQELNIYSHRQPFLIQPFVDAYEERTGTKINIVYASKGLAQRLQAEGARSPADVILTVDIARLHVYADKDLLAPVASETLQANIPAHLRDPENRWFAFSKRARVIVVAKRAEDAAEIRRYEDLADPTWRGRICARPGSHVYNRALVASFIHAVGTEATETWASGMVENLARRPQGNDRAQVKAIYEGVCDIAIINHYYFGKLKHSDKEAQRAWADAVSLIFPNQDDRGTHVNISGGGVAQHSKNKAEAIRFLEFLTSETAQKLYGSVNFEFPANPNVSPPEELASWVPFVEDQMPIARIAELAPEAQKVIDRVGW
jgi:iron(III) transport system substrate-binding protein